MYYFRRSKMDCRLNTTTSNTLANERKWVQTNQVAEEAACRKLKKKFKVNMAKTIAKELACVIIQRIEYDLSVK